MVGRLVIAGTHSGVGKTTLTAGLIVALRRRGLTVQPFKVGPDYLDPTFHTLAAGRPCRNLDTWLVPPERVLDLFRRAVEGVDVAVIEGVMGVFDGFAYDTETGSTAEVAKLLRAPVLLVLDVGPMARSAAAVALGFQRFDPALPLAGFLVNGAAGQGHGAGVRLAIEQATGLPVLGWLARAERLKLPERHLGLVPTVEPGAWREALGAAGDAVAGAIDLDRLLLLAESLPLPGPVPAADLPGPPTSSAGARPILAVARDEAFHFTYADNLDLLRAAGAEVVFFSPLRDSELPAGASGVILSGGFPEVYAEPLAANSAMKEALWEADRNRLPIYAECGGLMYLTRAIVEEEGRELPMVGLLPGRSRMSGRLTLGYRVARAATSSWLLRAGETVRGHEFHYSLWDREGADPPPAYELQPSWQGETAWREGACLGNLWASYVHLHFGAMPELALRFVHALRQAIRPPG